MMSGVETRTGDVTVLYYSIRVLYCVVSTVDLALTSIDSRYSTVGFIDILLRRISSFCLTLLRIHTMVAFRLVRAENDGKFHIFTLCSLKAFVTLRSGPTVTARGRFLRVKEMPDMKNIHIFGRLSLSDKDHRVRKTQYPLGQKTVSRIRTYVRTSYHVLSPLTKRNECRRLYSGPCYP